MTRTYQTVLTIAGSDSGGGAGIQADLKTVSALGCYGMSVITALTAQNTVGVTGIHAVPADFVAAQIDAVFEDMGADAVKIGMLFSAEIIRTVAERLALHGARRIVVDPVMVSQSGHRLVADDAVAALITHLLPLADILTPNLPEAEVLLGRKLDGDPVMAGLSEAARDLSALGPRSVLLKGGHGTGPTSSDLFYQADGDRPRELPADRVETVNTHGTGCTLSAALAAGLARGLPLESAVAEAKAYMNRAIRAGAEYQLGGGHGPVHHFHAVWS